MCSVCIRRRAAVLLIKMCGCPGGAGSCLVQGPCMPITGFLLVEGGGGGAECFSFTWWNSLLGRV